MAEVHGSCDERFGAVRAAFEANFDRGLEVGASCAVFYEGEPVVDLWGGYADAERTRPWESDTITNVWSTTKTMTAICALLLADRGELDLHAPVARYWPEFAAAGKDGIEVRHLLSHTAGLSGWTEPISVEDLFDWEKATSLLAAQEPWWEPGSASGYHAVTQGFLVGEVVRRVSGRTVGRFFAEEVAGPLGADFFIGTPPEADERVALVIPPTELPPMGELTPESLTLRTLLIPLLGAEASWTVPWRRAELPAAGGHGNARSVARVHAALACGGELDGVRLCSPAMCDPIFEEQADGVDLVLQIPLRFGIGYGLRNETFPIGERAFRWGGWGGSLVITDLEHSVSLAYVMNRMESGLVGDDRGLSIALAVAESIL